MSTYKSPIPIKNIFYMLCYAWNVLAIKDDIKVGEDDFDDAYNLLGRIFTYGIGKLIRSGFHRSYVGQEEELSTLRGKINVQESVTKFSMQRKKLDCNYDEYSTNDIFNQILKFTIENLIKNPNISPNTKTSLKKQRMFFVGIEEKAPTKDNRQKLVFNRNNVTYKMLIHVAIMLYDNTIVNDEDGNNVFKDFFRDGQMEKVYEQFILNFYAINLDRKVYRVHAPKINWHTTTDDSGWGEFFDVETEIGDRRTDIVVENKDLNYQFIIDAKYYKDMLVNKYYGQGAKTYRTSHINQIRGYILDSDYQGRKFGALMYPTVYSDEYNRGKIQEIQDYTGTIKTFIITKTLDLNRNWLDIEKDLLALIKNVDKKMSK